MQREGWLSEIYIEIVLNRIQNFFRASCSDVKREYIGLTED